MAQVTRSTIAPLHDKISIKISKEDYLPSFEKSLKQQAKNANVPGFRKGNVPAAILKKMYGPALYQDEVLRTASREMEKYMQAEKLSLLGEPMSLPSETPQTIDMNNPDDFTFDFEVGLKPDVHIPALNNGHVITRYKVPVTEEMIDRELRQQTERFGKLEDLAVLENEEEDVVVFETGVANEEGSKERPVRLKNLPEALRKKLLGRKTGEEVEVDFTNDFTKDEERRAFATEILHTDEIEGTHPVRIGKASRIQPAPVDENLFMQVYPTNTPADGTAFRNRLREDMERSYDHMSSQRMDNELLETLVHTTPIELPRDFLKRWMQQGGSDDKPRTAEEVEANFPQTEHQLRWQLIMDKLLNQYGVRVGKEDIRNEIKGRVMGYFGVEDLEDAPWMDSYVKSMEKDEKTMNETYQNLLFTRLFEKLRSAVPTEEKEISEKEFFALPSPGAAHHHH